MISQRQTQTQSLFFTISTTKNALSHEVHHAKKQKTRKEKNNGSIHDEQQIRWWEQDKQET